MIVDEHASQFLGTLSAKERCGCVILFAVGAALASIALLKINSGYAENSIKLA